MVKAKKLGARRLPSMSQVPEKRADIFDEEREIAPLIRSDALPPVASPSHSIAPPAYSAQDEEVYTGESLYESASTKQRRRRRMLLLLGLLMIALFTLAPFERDEDGEDGEVSSTWHSAWSAANAHVKAYGGWGASASGQDDGDDDALDAHLGPPAEEDDYPVVDADVMADDEGFIDGEEDEEPSYDYPEASYADDTISAKPLPAPDAVDLKGAKAPEAAGGASDAPEAVEAEAQADAAGSAPDVASASEAQPAPAKAEAKLAIAAVPLPDAAVADDANVEAVEAPKPVDPVKVVQAVPAAKPARPPPMRRQRRSAQRP